MKLYKHVRNTDVAIEIIKSRFIRENRTLKLKVAWWNIVKSHPPFPLALTQNIQVPIDMWINEWKPWSSWE